MKINHGTPASACWPCFSSAPLLPGTLCSGGVLLPPSSLLRPHAPVSCPPANFPLAVISPASRAGDLPCFASQTLRPCRRPYAGELLGGICPTLPQRSCLRRHTIGSTLSTPATAFPRGG